MGQRAARLVIEAALRVGADVVHVRVAVEARGLSYLQPISSARIVAGSITVVATEPAKVTAPDVFAFLKQQQAPRPGERVVRLEDSESGLSARAITRRLSSVSGLSPMVARGRCRGGAQSGPAWPIQPTTGTPWPWWGAAGADTANIATGARPG